MRLILGKSAPIAELCRQLYLRKYYKFKFWGIIFKDWELGITFYMKENK